MAAKKTCEMRQKHKCTGQENGSEQMKVGRYQTKDKGASRAWGTKKMHLEGHCDPRAAHELRARAAGRWMAWMVGGRKVGEDRWKKEQAVRKGREDK